MEESKATSAHRAARAWEDVFFAELRERGNVREAAEKAEIERTTVYKHRRERPEFAERWEEAIGDAADRLQREAWKRAVEGYSDVISLGRGETMVVTRYSDNLLKTLLEAHHPDFKRQQRIELTGKDGGPIDHRNVTELTDTELLRIASGDV